MRVLFTGGRDFTNKAALERLFNSFMLDGFDHTFKEVIVGDARGLDSLVRDVCEERGITCHVFKADWDTHGKAAGFIRNQVMVDQKPDLVIGGPGGNGTRHCLDRAHAAGILVLRLEP